MAIYTATVTVAIDTTRTSRRWNEAPGNFDKLNLKALYESDNDWGIPQLAASTHIPAKLVAYNDRHACRTAADAAVHFFLDDYRFETMWTLPNKSLERVQKVAAALTPDFSMWPQMPKVMQLWQVYRNRWCGRWMEQHGIVVTPTISWSTPDSYEYAFLGVTRGSVVAVSTVGIRSKEATWGYLQGLERMLDTLEPATVLTYGRSIGETTLFPSTQFRHYPTRWEE